MVGWMDAFAVAGFAKVVIRTPLTGSAGQWSECDPSESNGLLFALVTGSRDVPSPATIANDSHMAVWRRALSHPVVNGEYVVVVTQRLVSEVLARSTVFVELKLPYTETINRGTHITASNPEAYKDSPRQFPPLPNRIQ